MNSTPPYIQPDFEDETPTILPVPENGNNGSIRRHKCWYDIRRPIMGVPLWLWLLLLLLVIIYFANCTMYCRPRRYSNMMGMSPCNGMSQLENANELTSRLLADQNIMVVGV